MKGIGVLMPVSCLPKGKFSDGYKFIDWLAKGGYQYWQVLPLNPRDEFGSPYNSPNSLAIDPEYGTEKEWFALKKYANNNKIKIIGDLPYFITPSENKNLFIKNMFAGSPPDCYAKKGQYWGLPVFDWEEKYSLNLNYLLKRITRSFELFDILRLDHFRGYCAVWVVRKPYKTGRHGNWLTVPGGKIMAKIKQKFPDKIFVAEDLGVITEDVDRLRKKSGLLGSAVIQYGEINNKDIVYYTSTHDSETLKGFYGKKSGVYLKKVLNSKAVVKIIPMWDILGLNNLARLNKPGTKKCNWGWRLDTRLQFVYTRKEGVKE